METIQKPSSSAQSKHFTNVGFGEKAKHLEGNIHTAVTVDHVDKVTPSMNDISRGAKWTPSELERLTKSGATQAQINKLAEALPLRVLMSKALKKRGLPVPPDISDLLNSFYTNVIKTSSVGKHFQYVEGNPIIYKMHASAAVVSSLVDLVPAATNFVNAAMSKESGVNDAQLIQDAKDIKDFINAKAQGLPTENIGVGKTATVSPWIIGGILVILVILAAKYL
jgi:hypothetical protein